MAVFLARCNDGDLFDGRQAPAGAGRRDVEIRKSDVGSGSSRERRPSYGRQRDERAGWPANEWAAAPAGERRGENREELRRARAVADVVEMRLMREDEGALAARLSGPPARHLKSVQQRLPPSSASVDREAYMGGFRGFRAGGERTEAEAGGGYSANTRGQNANHNILPTIAGAGLAPYPLVITPLYRRRFPRPPTLIQHALVFGSFSIYITRPAAYPLVITPLYCRRFRLPAHSALVFIRSSAAPPCSQACSAAGGVARVNGSPRGGASVVGSTVAATSSSNFGETTTHHECSAWVTLPQLFMTPAGAVSFLLSLSLHSCPAASGSSCITVGHRLRHPHNRPSLSSFLAGEILPTWLI
nr:unnamed protein product [Digitaria exilis]